MATADAAPATGGLRTVAARLATAAAGSAPVAATYAGRHRHQLRILAYHRVPDPEAFGRQLDLLASRYDVVGEDRVRDALAGGQPLGERSLWLTFDDGDPTVVSQGLPELVRRGLTATVYVCPALVDEHRPPWWTVVEAARHRGGSAEVGGVRRSGQELITTLKRLPDAERRAVVDELAPLAEGHLPEPAALTRGDLERWVDAGGTVGNHTWDHPCLDQCDPTEQRRQIVEAHAWLQGFQADRMPTFAYPNGDRTDEAEAVLAELGYDVALLFDHRLADPVGNPLRLSRLRLDSDAPPARTRAVASGAHSALFARLGG